MAKAKLLLSGDGNIKSYAFECPGCNMWHSCNVEGDDATLSIWAFNGNVEAPTFSPSVLVRYPIDGLEMVCHSFVENGFIRFLSDCTHELRSQTVELPEME